MESSDLFSHPYLFSHPNKPAVVPITEPSSEEAQIPAFSDRPQRDSPTATQPLSQMA
jgi:hypothetical protein